MTRLHNKNLILLRQSNGISQQELADKFIKKNNSK